MFVRGLLCMIGIALAAGPTSAPSTSQTLLDGAILYTPPADWVSLGKRTDDRSAGYAPSDHSGQIVITVVPEAETIPDELGPKLAMQFGQTIRAEAAKKNIQIVQQPKVEEDKRFLVKIHDQFKAHEKFSDRVQIFRGVGRNLVSVTINAFTEDPDQQKQIDLLGEEVMLSVALNRPGAAAAKSSESPETQPTTQPILFPAPHLRVTPPIGWKRE